MKLKLRQSVGSKNLIQNGKDFRKYMPQVLAVVVLTVIVGYVIRSSFAAAATLIGDLNSDGIVNVVDLSMLLSHWGQTASPTPTPSNTPTPTPTPTATVSATPTPSGCVYTPNGANDTYYFPSAVPYIVGAASNPWAGPNIWGGGASYQQTMCINAPNSWYITANGNTNWGPVQTYPNTGFDMGGTIVGSTSITSSWNVTIPTDTTKVAGWSGYDLWFNNWADEVMILTDITVPTNGTYDCTGVATITVSGIPWHMCDFGSERVWKPGTDDQHLVNRISGSVDVRAILTWMEQNGKLPDVSTWTASSFGFEVCDTHGTAQRFTVNDFSWDSH